MFDDDHLSLLLPPPSHAGSSNDPAAATEILIDLAPAMVTTTVESVGSTSLMHVDSTYSLDPAAGGMGPLLRFGGAPVTDGAFGAWMPIGTEQVDGGYRVAWQFGSADLYQVWSVDGGGNYTSTGAAMSGGANGDCSVDRHRAKFADFLTRWDSARIVGQVIPAWYS